MSQNIKNIVVLVGMMGCGKTTIGRQLARHLGLPFADSDETIEARAGRAITEIFAQNGENHFRTLEEEIIEHIIKEITENPAKTGIMALGGGALGSEKTRALIKQKTTAIWLKAPSETLRARLKTAQDRPLLAGGDKYAILDRLLAEREPFYQEADIIIDATGSSEHIMEAIIGALRKKKILRSPSTK